MLLINYYVNSIEVEYWLFDFEKEDANAMFRQYLYMSENPEAPK